MVRAFFALILGGIAATAIVATASAAPKNQETIAVDCGADGMFQVLGNNGNGTFTPAKIIGGGTFIPLAFSNQHGTFVDTDGNVFTQDEPDAAKHASPPNKHLLSCHFELTFADEGGSGTFSGDVVGFIAGGH